MQRSGTPQALIERWLQGQEFAAQLARRREALTTRVFLSSTSPGARTPGAQLIGGWPIPPDE